MKVLIKWTQSPFSDNPDCWESSLIGVVAEGADPEAILRKEMEANGCTPVEWTKNEYKQANGRLCSYSFRDIPVLE